MKVFELSEKDRHMPKSKDIQGGKEVIRLLKIAVWIFLISFGITLMIGVSFIFTGGFSSRTFSDRVFWIGMIVTVACTSILSALALFRRNFDIPRTTTKVKDAWERMEHDFEVRKKLEVHYTLWILGWLVGIICIVFSALIQILLSKFNL
jgi:magnesium-transporting ATPase (P-type)